MIELMKNMPLEGQYVYKTNKIDIKDISKHNVNTIYIVDPEVDENFIKQLEKLLSRKRVYTIYIESLDNKIIKEKIAKNPKRHMISFIYDFETMEESGKLTIYDFIRVDLDNNETYLNKLLKISEKLPCTYIIKNAPDLSKLKCIPSNYRFEYETNQQEV